MQTDDLLFFVLTATSFFLPSVRLSNMQEMVGHRHYPQFLNGCLTVGCRPSPKGVVALYPLQSLPTSSVFRGTAPI